MAKYLDEILNENYYSHPKWPGKRLVIAGEIPVGTAMQDVVSGKKSKPTTEPRVHVRDADRPRSYPLGDVPTRELKKG